jgi:replicative DNA helicase
MIQASAEIVSQAFEAIDDTEAFLDEAERKVFLVSDTKLSKSFSSMQEIILQNMHSIEELAQKRTDVIGLATGFHDFDRLSNGLRAGQLVILAARPAMGKTSLFLSIAQNIAATGNAIVAIFSLEMSKEELAFRFLSGMSRIESKKLKVGRLGPNDWPRLADAADQLSKSKIFIDDSGDLTVMDIRSRCRRLLSSEKGLGLIVIDYLQLMKGSRATQKGDGSREREISEISRNLKNLAKEIKVPILALSQLNRGVESRPNKRPMLSDLRESGAIEQDADMVCFIYRDEVYNKESEDKGVAELIVAKHRSGETDTIRLAWLPQFTLFSNLENNAAGTPLVSPRPEKGDHFV